MVLYRDRHESSDHILSPVRPALSATDTLIDFAVSAGILPTNETTEVLAHGVPWLAGPRLGSVIPPL